MLYGSGLEDMAQRVDDPRQRGVVIRGPFGVGKTERLKELIRAERSRGSTVFEGAGTRVAQTEPFGAFAHLVPELDPGENPVQALRKSHRVLATGNSPTRRALLAVDDAHFLDEWSAAFLHQAALTGSAFLVVTIQIGKPVHQNMSALLRAPGFTVVELRSLSDAEAADFLRRMLDGPVDTFAMTQLIRLSGGNPSWLRRLVDDARRRGALELKGGVWQRTTDLASPEVVSALSDELLASLSEPEIEVLDLLAIGKTLELAVLEQLVDLGTLESLERAGFIHVDSLSPASSTSLASHAVGELLIRRMAKTRQVRLSRLLATVMPGNGQDWNERDLPLPTWLLEAGKLDDPAQYERAARLALANGDFELAERYAAAAIRDGAGEAAKVLLAEALAGLGEAEKANAILSALVATSTEDAHVAQAALAQMRHARYMAGIAHDAVSIGHAALAKLESPDWQDGIGAELALHAGLEGDFTMAAEFAATVLERPNASDRAILEAAIVSSQALVMLGRLDDALKVIRLATPLVAPLAAELPTAQGLLDFSEFQAYLFKGDLSGAEKFSGTLLVDALDRRVPGWVGLWTLASGSVKLFQGRVIESAQELCAALGHLASFDPLRIVPIGTAWRALAEVQAGMLGAAQNTLESMPPEYLPGEFRVNAFQKGVEAWLRAQGADTAGAAQLSRSAGIELIDHTHITLGALFLHHAARFGHGEVVVTELAELAAQVDSDLISAMSMHANAQASGDAEMLQRASDEFERMGFVLLAAETATQAAEVLGKRGTNRAAARASVRGANLAALAEGADTPAIRGLHRFLTPREQGIARLAMQGITSREISESLGISVRTVNNHLGSVYAKLGIHGRAELASVIGAARNQDPVGHRDGWDH